MILNKILNENINDIKQTQLDLENQLNDALNKTGNLKDVTRNLKAATHSINRAFKQNPLGSDIFEKIESDRYLN